MADEHKHNDDIIDNGVEGDSESSDREVSDDEVNDPINEYTLAMSVDKFVNYVRDDIEYIHTRIMETDFEEIKEYTSVFGIGAVSVFIIMYIRQIIMFIAMIGSALGINFMIVSYVMRRSGIDDEMIDFTFSHDPEIQRLKFQNSNYEELYKAYMKVNEDNQPFDDIGKLKDTEEHVTIDASALPCKKVIMYYDEEDDVFKYYTQVGDMTQTMLNAACRHYCLEKNVVQLYNDESDWAFMVETYGSEEDRKKLEKYLPSIKEEPESKTTVSDSSEGNEKRKGSFVDVTEKSSDDDDDVNGKDETPSIFVSKSEKSQKKEDNTAKRNTIVEKKTNRYLKMGSIDDYETNKNMKERSEQTKDVDYKTFMQSLFSKPKQE